MRRETIIAARRLLSATFFFIAAVFIFANVGVFKISSLSSVDTILTIAWASCWALTAIHQIFYRGVVAYRASNAPEKEQKKNSILGLKRSTHSHIKSTLITTTATSACVMDFYRIQKPNLAHISRLTGSIAWLSLGIYEVWLASRHERKQEQNPHKEILPCGIRPSVYYAIHATIYMLIGITYAIAVWSDDENSPLAVSPTVGWIIPVPNICWLLAGLNELSRTMQTLIEDNNKHTKETQSHEFTKERNNAIDVSNTTEDVDIDTKQLRIGK